MSYTARTLLINTVLLSLHSYWSQVFVLPRKVLIGINKIYRAFLWGGHAYCSKAVDVTWEKLCAHKSPGGLGFKNIVTWNTKSLDKYVWVVSTN